MRMPSRFELRAPLRREDVPAVPAADAPALAGRSARGLARVLLSSALTTLAMLTAGCGDDPVVATPTSPLSERYAAIAQSLGKAVAAAKSSATSATTSSAADFAGIAHLPAAVTGGLDLTADQAGKTGEKATNIDGDEGEEAVTLFVPDASKTGGTSATAPSLATWRGDAASADSGLCHLAWSKGSTWIVTSRCGDTSGAWVCQITSGDASCSACNEAGECSPCDVATSTFTCAWP